MRAPLFLPYLSGERTPHNDPFAQGVWFGLQHDTDRAALGYSVLEGVAFGLADGYAALQAAGGSAHSVLLTGGGSRSVYWASLIASILDLPLALPEGSEIGAALGAARLGLLAAEPKATIDAVCTTPRSIATIEPNATWRDALLSRVAKFRSSSIPLASPLSPGRSHLNRGEHNERLFAGINPIRYEGLRQRQSTRLRYYEKDRDRAG
jgi:xylulokinase